MEKTMDAPTTKRNVGKTRSVAVKPFHSAWRISVHAPSPPGLFTMIMKAMVRPRSTSTDNRRRGAETIVGPVMAPSALLESRIHQRYPNRGDFAKMKELFWRDFV